MSRSWKRQIVISRGLFDRDTVTDTARVLMTFYSHLLPFPSFEISHALKERISFRLSPFRIELIFTINFLLKLLPSFIYLFHDRFSRLFSCSDSFSNYRQTYGLHLHWSLLHRRYFLSTFRELLGVRDDLLLLTPAYRGLVGISMSCSCHSGPNLHIPHRTR